MKNYIIVAFVALLIGAIGGSQLFPRVKEKIVETEKESTQKDVQTIVKVITKPDGTKEEVTTIIDKSKENKEVSKTKVISKSDWHASVGASREFSKETLTYSLQIERRILSDIYLGVMVNSEKKIGATIGIDF